MAGHTHYEEKDIEEVFDYFADAFQPPAGMEIRKITPHYDPRKGTVIFAMYLEDVDPPADEPLDPHA
jgi:hypothetical protein